MKKNISFSTSGQRADIGPIQIHRILPNRYSQAVGPFVFLDHFGPMKVATGAPRQVNGNGAHPHRGIATLTYLLNGEEEHFDSKENYGKIQSGGVQWMKAGSGIVHDGNVNPDPHTKDHLVHGFQFWINLPAKNKIEPPMHMAIQAGDVPQMLLPDGRGWIKVIVGQYADLKSAIPNYSRQFLYHIQLNPRTEFSLEAKDGMEYAAFLPLAGATINDREFKGGEFIEFGRSEGTLDFSNTSKGTSDVLLFGGEPYSEPIVAQGPFVMNTSLEITEAYKDFHAGKYGKMSYNRVVA